MTRRRGGWSDITFTDQFCGAGGSSIGAMRIGLRGALAMNHWAQACETYATNNPQIPVDCADVSSSDPRKYPSTDILITSPECTTHSPAGGNRRSKPRDLFTFDAKHLDDPAFARSRATMWDVPRFAEYHQYKAIIVENVVEVLRWDLFPVWLAAMHRLGYRHKLVCLNSMFCHPTPQSRDRLYIVFWKKGNRAPDLDIRPIAPCPKHGNVHALQLWKNGRHVGKYRFQYLYACPQCAQPVTPYYYAALNAIDFTLPAERIGDRARPLKERTLERIRYGLEKYGRRMLVVNVKQGERDASRAWAADLRPIGTVPSWDGYFGVASPFIVGCANTDGIGRRVSGLDEYLSTVHAGGNNHALVSPFILNISRRTDNSKVRGVDEALPSQTTQQEVALAMPFVFNVAGRDSTAPVDRAMPTQETREKFALLTPFLVMERTHNNANGLDEPLPTACAGTVHHALVQGAAQISLRDADAMRVAGLDRELMTQGCAPQQAVVSRAPFLIQYYGNEQASGAAEAVPTVTVRDRHGLVQPSESIDVEDCYFRMLQPHEIGAAMAFPHDYKVLGNKRDRVKQYGNAVTPPAMSELIRRVVASFAPEVAA